MICGSNLHSSIFLYLLTKALPLFSFVGASPSLFSFCNSHQTKENERERQRTTKEWVRMVSERDEAKEWMVATTPGYVFPLLLVLVWVQLHSSYWWGLKS
jgi:hypothetical protein